MNENVPYNNEPVLIENDDEIDEYENEQENDEYENNQEIEENLEIVNVSDSDEENKNEDEIIEIENNEQESGSIGEVPDNTRANEVNEIRGDGRMRRSTARIATPRLDMTLSGKKYGNVQMNRAGKQLLNMKKTNFKSKRKNNIKYQMLMKKILPKKELSQQECMNKCLDIMCTQKIGIKKEPTKDMTASQGIKLWGEEALTAIMKEFSQMNSGPKGDQPVIEPIDTKLLTDEEKSTALSAVNLIKRKRSGKLKARKCANGSTQRKYLGEYESVASPTVSFEAQISTLLIDAVEGRKVTTFDIPGAYLHADMPESKKLLLKLRGKFVEIMCDVNKEYKKHVLYEKGQKVLYMKISKAIYGCIESALIWYELYVSVLGNLGFELNQYDRCVANKMVNGNQCTIVWYVDDNKISHREQEVVDEILEIMTKHFGEMTVTKGHVHEFLGFKFTLHKDKIEIDMKDQINEAIEMFMDDVNQTVSTPAAPNLFQTRSETSSLLDNKRKENFHSVTMKIMYIMKRARPDVEVAIAFLCTRVTKPNEHDWKKLKRVLCWLKQTIDETRFIGADNIDTLYSWVDAAYPVTKEMRSQTGGAISMGRGLLHAKSSKQKLNTKSSTEAEIVGVSDYLPYSLWFANFFKEQGYELKRNVLYQDNQSAIRMERNGRNSCTGNSRHIDIRYFFTKDRYQKGEIDIDYCPTYRMLADYFTKPLQGALFNRFWKVIMGHEHINKLKEFVKGESLENKERVENNEFQLVFSNDRNIEKKNLDDKKGCTI